MRALFAVALFAACGGGESHSSDLSAMDDMSVVGHYARCATQLGEPVATCGPGLVCTMVPPCSGTAVDPPSACLEPDEKYCFGVGADGGT